MKKDDRVPAGLKAGNGNVERPVLAASVKGHAVLGNYIPDSGGCDD